MPSAPETKQGAVEHTSSVESPVWVAKGGERTMNLADQMQNMADSFLQAQDLRTNRLKEIFEETNADLDESGKMLRGFHTERLENMEALQKMLRQFTNTLVKEVEQAMKGFRTARKQMSGKLHEELERFTETLAKETQDTLKHFRLTHKALSGEQREQLAKFVKSLETETEKLCKDAQAMRKAFHKGHREMSQELHGFLSTFAARNHKQTAQFLRACNTQHKQTAKAQRESLAGYVGANAKETARMRKHFGTEQKQRMEALGEQIDAFLKGLQQTVRQMKKATHKLTESFHDDQMKGRHAWQQMATSMGKKRQGRPEKPPGGSRPERRGEAEVELLKLLTENPTGMTLAELSYAMEIPSAATSKMLNRMLKRKDAPVRKKGQLYLLS